MNRGREASIPLTGLSSACAAHDHFLDWATRACTKSKTPYLLGPRHAWRINSHSLNALSLYPVSAINPMESPQKRSSTWYLFSWDPSHSWEFLSLFSVSTQSMCPGCYVASCVRHGKTQYVWKTALPQVKSYKMWHFPSSLEKHKLSIHHFWY